MTKKRIILIISIITSPILLLIIARILSWYAFYTNSTVSMEPKIKIGGKLFGSSLLKPKVNDVISYYASPAYFENITEDYLAICRIVGKENDIIEIKNGVLYKNNIAEKDTLNLCYFFKIKTKDLNLPLSKYDEQNRAYQFSETETILNFSYNELIKLNIINNCERLIDTTTSILNPGIFGKEFNDKKWSIDNFGPVKVPKGHLFLLGDNRSNSADSRLRGCTSIDKIIAKIIE